MNVKSKPVMEISKSAARLAIAAVITYHVTLIALIFIRPDLDVRWNTLSEYALGPHGWIMSTAFLISALSYGSLFVTVKSQIRGIAGKIGLTILFICCLGTVGVGLFTTDPFTVTKLSTRGIIHIVTGTSALMLLPFAALLINLSIALKNEAWSPARRALLWTAGLPLLGFIGFLIHLSIFVMPLEADYGPGVPLGWSARFLFWTYMLWLIVLAWQAIKVRERN